MRFRTGSALFLSALVATGLCQDDPQFPARRIYRLDNGTWIENVVARYAGHIVMTLIDRPELYEVDPTHQHGGPRSIHTFEEASSLHGITELERDVFAVLSSTKDESGEAAFASLWHYNRTVNSEDASTRVIEKVGDATWLNGLTTLSPTVVLASDSTAGTVYRIDLEAATAEIVIQDATMKPGINGVRYREPYLFFTNVEQSLFARVPIDPQTAEPTGDVEVLVEGEMMDGADDFALTNWTPDAFVMSFTRNRLVRVRIPEEEGVEATAEVLTEDLPAPTSGQFLYSGNSTSLYIVTSGTGEADGGAAGVYSVNLADLDDGAGLLAFA